MDYSFLFGKTVQEACQYLKDIGIPFRVSSDNNMPTLITSDYNVSRVNLQVKNGVVQKIYIG